jgi:hypothetical protein
MAEAQQPDDVADKAAQIGHAVGVDDMPEQKEEIPDYEIIEDDADDKRIAKERNPDANKPRKPTTTKEKREVRKQKLIAKVTAAKDQEIQDLRIQLQHVVNRQSQVDKQLTDADKQKVEENINQAASLFNAAEKNLEAAFTEGDGAKHTKATKDMYAAQKAIEYWQGVKQQYNRAPAAPTNQIDPRIIAKKEAFENENRDWYNPQGGDEDSEIAKGISNTLVKKGLDPASDEFWDELKNRLIDRGVIESDDEDGTDEYEEEDKPAPQPRKRASPPVGGGSNRDEGGGKKQVRLPAYFVDTLKQNGLWNNPEVRNKQIHEFQKLQKQNKA